MKVRICDICGRVIGSGWFPNDPDPQVIVKTKNANGKYEKLELCADCKNAMMNWCRKHRGDVVE